MSVVESSIFALRDKIGNGNLLPTTLKGKMALIYAVVTCCGMFGHHIK